MDALLILGGVGAVAAFTIIGVISKLIYICPPNEALVFAGSRRNFAGRDVGYRLIQGGRGVRIPLLEQVSRLDLTNMIIDIKVTGAYSKGGIPLDVEGVANLKIASQENELANAIERLLGKSREDIIRIARETLEGNLRGVLATLTPEEVNHDRLKFAESLLHEAEIDLRKLGLDLDTLKIQHVSDSSGYLDSIGRKQSASLAMRSRIAEAENRALAAERSASNLETQELARVAADIQIAQADAEKRIADAQSKRAAMVAEQRGYVAAQVAKARGELELQNERLEQVRLQLIADEVKPAEAKRQQMIEAARGDAAKIVQDGKATAESLRSIARTWNEAGDSARQVFLAQKLSGLVAELMGTVKDLPIDKVTFIDSKLTQAGGGNFAMNAAVTSEQLKHTLGVDVPAILQRLQGTDEKSSSPPPIPA